MQLIVYFFIAYMQQQNEAVNSHIEIERPLDGGITDQGRDILNKTEDLLMSDEPYSGDLVRMFTFMRIKFL